MPKLPKINMFYLFNDNALLFSIYVTPFLLGPAAVYETLVSVGPIKQIAVENRIHNLQWRYEYRKLLFRIE